MNYILTLNKKASGMNELYKGMNYWNESRVEKKVRIGRDIAKRRKKRKKELSTIDERRAIEKYVIKIAYRFIEMSCTDRGRV
jgi:hypothetical protein